MLQRQVQRHSGSERLTARKGRETRCKRRADRQHANRPRLPVQLVPPGYRQRRAVIQNAEPRARHGRQQNDDDFIPVSNARHRRGRQLDQKNRRGHRHPIGRFRPKPRAQPKQCADGELPAARQRPGSILRGKTQHNTRKARRNAEPLPQQHSKHRALTAVSAAREPRKR